MDEATARWEIRGLSWFRKTRDNPIKSGTILEVLGSSWEIVFHPVGQTDPECPSFWVKCFSERNIKAKGKITVCNQNGGEQTTSDFHPPLYVAKEKKFVNDDDVKYESWGYRKFMTWTLLDTHVKDDVLVLELTVQACLVDSKGQIEFQHLPTVARSAPSAVGADLAVLLCEGKYTDMVLRAGIGETEVSHPAHRVVLASRSPVFASMLYGGGMREAAAADVEVAMPDMAPDMAQLFLHCIYTDEVKEEAWMDDEVLCHLLSALHKYQVGPLAERCEARVVALLSEENCAERLVMADMLGISGLRKATLDFMVGTQQRLSRVQTTDGFQRLAEKRPHLLKDILAQAAPPAKRPRGNGGELELPVNLTALRVMAIKQLLSDRGLPTTGTKLEMIERLRQHAAEVG